LPPNALPAIERSCTWRRYQPGEQILDRDSDSRDVFLVVEGMVEVVNYSITGREVAFGQVKAGGYFGELAAIDGRRRSANVVASEDSLVAIVPPDVFTAMLLDYPALALNVLRRLAHIIRTADERIMDLSTLKAVQRVHVEVLRLTGQDGDHGSANMIAPVPTQRELARRASTSRETVARVLSQLIKGGIISRRGRTVRVNDMDRLRALAEPDRGEDR
jgi:CRP-like cAMP-binding protein